MALIHVSPKYRTEYNPNGFAIGHSISTSVNEATKQGCMSVILMYQFLKYLVHSFSFKWEYKNMFSIPESTNKLYFKVHFKVSFFLVIS